MALFLNVAESFELPLVSVGADKCRVAVAGAGFLRKLVIDFCRVSPLPGLLAASGDLCFESNSNGSELPISTADSRVDVGDNDRSSSRLGEYGGGALVDTDGIDLRPDTAVDAGTLGFRMTKLLGSG